MYSSVTFDELAIRAYVSRKRRAAIVRGTAIGSPVLGMLYRGDNRALLWESNPANPESIPCPATIFATVATMI